MEEHFLLAPNFHLFFHQPNIPRKWKFSFTMAITTSKPEELCIIQTIITVISFLTLLLCSIGQHIRLCRKPRYLNILVSQMTVLLVFCFLFLRMSECVVPENIHTPPTEGIFPMTPPPLWIFQKLTLKTDPPSPPEIPFLSHTPWKYYHFLWKPKIRYCF